MCAREWENDGMYSEHVVAEIMDLVDGTVTTGSVLDASMDRVVVEIGRILGPLLGSAPSDAALAWYASQYGTPAPIGARAAVHVLKGSRTAVGLGYGRGVVETAGDRLVVVQWPESGRYTAAYRLPNISYGGLI